MNQDEKRWAQVLAYLGKAAATAADGVNQGVQKAGGALGGKYNEVKLQMEIARLQNEQSSLFSGIGQAMFLAKYGVGQKPPASQEAPDAEAVLDALLLQAMEKQEAIDQAAKKLSELAGQVLCPACNEVCSIKACFCSVCGAQLPKPEPEAEQEAEPEAEPEENE